MKVLSKYLKVALCFMAFALCSFMFAFAPTLTAVQAAEMAIEGYNVAINALKMPTEEVDYNTPGKDVFKVPLLKEVLGAVSTNYTIRVVDPAGYKHDLDLSEIEDAEDITDSFFSLDAETLAESSNVIVNAKNDGEYKVIYIVSEGTGAAKRTYYSNSYKVTVVNVSYELDFATPVVEKAAGEDEYKVVGYTKNLVKTALATSNQKYELPLAYAKVVGEDIEIDAETGKITSKTAKVNVTFSPQDGTYEGDVFTEEIGADGITRYSITPSEEGIYTVEYYFDNSANRPSKTYKIVVEDNYEAGDLKLASTPTMPKIELGQTVTLPKLTVNAGTEKNVDVDIVSIKIEKEGSNGEIAYELTNNNLEFVMSHENFSGVTNYADMVGNYRITYTVKGAHAGQELTETFKVDGVTVSSKPTIKLSYNYDATQANYAENVVFGAETELKAEYAVEATTETGFVLPAVYVEDAVTERFDDFIVIRTIRKGSTYYYVDNLKYNETTGEFDTVESSAKGYNASGDENIGDPTKSVTFKFNTENDVNKNTTFEGTYYLEYRVISKEVKERESVLYAEGTTEKYSFKVVTNLSDYEDPTIDITNLKDSAVKNTATLTVKVSATDTRDTRLKTAVFTHSGRTANEGIEDLETFEDYLAHIVDNLGKQVGTNKSCHLLDDERLIMGWDADGKVAEVANEKGLAYYFNNVTRLTENETKNNFDLDLKDATGTVSVVAATINDGGRIATDVKELSIKNTNDSEEPDMNIYASKLDEVWKNGSSIKEFKVGQGEKVTLPSVYVVDTDKTLSLNVMYYIDSPENSYGAIQYKSPANKNFYYDTLTLESVETEVQVIDGGTITTSETGVYYVAYTATDVAGNTSVMYFTFEVVDTSKPILSVEPVADEITIAGNTVTGTKGTVIDFETMLKSADGKLDYTKDAKFEIKIEDGGKGLDYQPSGNSKLSYEFNDYGTYVVTITGSYTRVDDDKGTPEKSDDETTTLTADSKVVKVIIEKHDIEWLGSFDVTEYAKAGTTIKLPDVAASNGAVVKVKYIAPNDTEDEAVEATKVVENGYSYWTFTTDANAKGSFRVIYTATTEDDVLTKELKIKVGDYQAPTLTYNAGELTQNYVYDGENDIEYVLEVNKKNKTFVVKVINNGKEVISHDIGLVISDTDDSLTGGNQNMSWTNLSYELTGDHVVKGESSTEDNTTTTRYSITGPGSYSLKFTMKDSYENVNDRESIDFKVVTKASIKENKDAVIGAVLIVISLILLAGVIVFFAFTGKNGSNKTKTNKTNSRKINSTKEVKTEVKSEVKAEEIVEEKTEVVEEAEAIEEKVDEEPKTGDVE